MSDLWATLHVVIQEILSLLLAMIFTYFFWNLPPHHVNVLLVLNLYIIWALVSATFVGACLIVWRQLISGLWLSACIVGFCLIFICVHTIVCLFVGVGFMKLRLAKASSFDSVHCRDPQELANHVLKVVLSFVVPMDGAISAAYLLLQQPTAPGFDYLTETAQILAMPMLPLFVDFTFMGLALAAMLLIKLRLRRHLMVNRSAAVIVGEQSPGPNTNSTLPLKVLFLGICIYAAVITVAKYSLNQGDKETVPVIFVGTPILCNLSLFGLIYNPRLWAFLRLRHAQNRLPVVSSLTAFCRSIHFGRRPPPSHDNQGRGEGDQLDVERHPRRRLGLKPLRVRDLEEPQSKKRKSE